MVDKQDARTRELKDLESILLALRQTHSGMGPHVSAEVLHSMAETFFQGLPLSEAASLLPDSGSADGDPEGTALRILRDYGSWVAKTLKDKPQAPWMFAADAAQLQLFAAPRKETRGVLTIPLGYERALREGSGSGSGSEGADALVNLMFHRPDAAQAGRYTHSLSRKLSRPLSFDVLSAVWGFASRSRLAGLVNVGGDARFLELSLEAYRLLDTYRADAIAALSRLMSDNMAEYELVLESTTRCFWLAEREVGRIRSAAEAGEPAALASAKMSLRQSVMASSVPIPGRVGELTAGQIRRIGHISGLLDDDFSLQDEREIRARLKKMGLGRDADKLTQDGVTAMRSGSIDRFWEAMDARLEGDMSWPELLAESIS